MKGNDTVLIMGLGLHGGGLGAANYFLSGGSRVIITDLKSEKELRKSIEKLKSRKNVRFVLGRHDFEDFRNVDLIIKNPAVPLDSPYIKHAL
ncbi:MAG: UDP-N-acetylmuramoyl-L-alanine--D-glutamate ligase, partial [Spirochaetes bacterium]|nr:UDP-N-acetylmuramoyl-L-alanine--D-glutamate ligase [Spirochaetota bacterium]